jgi:hypothetical protein
MDCAPRNARIERFGGHLVPVVVFHVGILT